jgi:PAS domain S-box-containing protein
LSRATLPLDETERLAVLQALKLLDTAPDPGFDRIVRLARALSGADSAAVSLLDQERLWFKARSGVDACEIPRDIGFCSHAILESEVLWIEDARADLRFADNPLVTGPPHVRFYAGAPIVVDGRALGAVCVFDPRPQPFDATFEAQLRDLADLAAAEVQSRRAHQVASLSESIAAATADAILCGDRAGRITYWNKAAERMFGYTAEEALGRSLTLIIPERMRGLHSAGYAAVAAGGPGKLAGKPVEVPAQRRDGTEFPAELSLAVWGSGSRGGVAAILRDLQRTPRPNGRGGGGPRHHGADGAQCAGVPGDDRSRPAGAGSQRPLVGILRPPRRGGARPDHA